MEKKKKTIVLILSVVIIVATVVIIGVKFQNPKRYLTISVVGQGTTDPIPGVYSFANREKVNVIAYSFPGWELEGWSGDAGGNESSIIITMDSNKEIIANFTNILPIENYTLIIIVVGGGTTDPLPGVHEYRSWTFINVTAIPNPGWIFDYWSSGGVNGSQNPLIVPMNKNRTVTAFFK